MGQGAVKAASGVQASLPKNATPAVRALAEELTALNDAGSNIIGKTRAAKAERESAADFLERKKAMALAEQVIGLSLPLSLPGSTHRHLSLAPSKKCVAIKPPPTKHE